MQEKATAGILNILATAALQAASFLGGVWTATIVGVAEFGALQMLRLVVDYCSFLRLGVPQAVSIELPVALGRKDVVEAGKPLGILAWTLLATVAVGLLLSCIPEAVGIRINGLHIQGQWILAGMLLACTSAALFPNLVLVSQEMFGRLALLRLCNAAVLGVVTALAVPVWGIRGFLVALAAGCGTEVLLWALRPTNRVSLYWSWTRWRRYVGYGLSIKSAGFLLILVTSVDLWIVSLFLGPSSAGLYGFAILLIRGYQFLPQMLYEMAFPRMAKMFGRADRDPNRVIDHLVLYGAGAASMSACSAILSFAVFSALIDHWLPQFAQAKSSFGILVVGNFFASATAMCSGMLYMAGKHRQMTALLAVTLASAATLDLLAVYFIESIPAVASATALCLTGKALCVFSMTARLITEKGRLGPLMRSVVGRFIVVAAGILAVRICGLTWPGWTGTALSFFIAAAACVPLGLSALWTLRSYWSVNSLSRVR